VKRGDATSALLTFPFTTKIISVHRQRGLVSEFAITRDSFINVKKRNHSLIFEIDFIT